MSNLIGNQLSPLNLLPFTFPANYNRHQHYITPFNNSTKIKSKSLKLSAQSDDSAQPTTTQQQVNLSVLRFTFGIPWLDESYLPRWIGYGFGSLIVLNHFVGSSSPVSSAQLVSEVLGLSLAAFSVTLPFMGKFLKGATQEEAATIPERAQQIFVMSQNVSDILKDDLAWATYILLRNTKSVSVLISLQDVICVRGYWNTPETLSKDEISNWFTDQIKKFGLSDVKESVYYPQSTGSILEEAVPDGTSSILIQPVLSSSRPTSMGMDSVSGFVLLASSLSYAFSDKDRLWIQAIANKFRGETTNMDSELS